ncbi:aconitase/3-isopropylmalate dehydratase large subunit family protein [Streptomyces tubbatahanensis]|uniref:Aconitase/3-isopropylmalate dehydratase large subunit family protein n=1 Tax=Streptomyces tubbatahanensis TaxID=2923272 RepID=A0ABY3Y1K0_9ACTN|nr:aconitase/3-isopropylmalate dehydratase large subunit family protein [Streptomyces tubbatahanensis]UNT00655.1 aconitase/3-isopropylmalate dehydratase large subunit family protein [Streptomyces tubbatahanensis]
MNAGGRTISDKIIDAHTVDPADTGVYREVRVDALLGHDATIALLVDEFERRGLQIWDRERVIFTNDHFSPPATIERADISNTFLRFARKRNVTHLMLDRGICHQLLVENPLCTPGSLIVGADSHTVMAGGLGACATGMGSTDILYALATGTTWMQRPATVRVDFHGSLGELCNGRDVVLELLRLLGESGARYRSLEFHDLADRPLGQDDRFAISNMAVELGAKFGVFVPDDVTAEYCAARDGRRPALVAPDPDALYEHTVDLDLSALTPRIAKPWSPGNVVAVQDIETRPVSVAFLGSCSSGRITDIRDAAEELDGKTVHPDVRFVVIPASVHVFQQALRAGYVTTLTEAGAVFDHSSCGPCGGIDKGVLGADDVCVSTSNRNFRGRMGHWESRTYLASARTVARAARAGHIGPDLYEAGGTGS